MAAGHVSENAPHYQIVGFSNRSLFGPKSYFNNLASLLSADKFLARKPAQRF